MALPLSAIDSGDPGASWVIEMLPLALPEEVGANLTVKDVLEVGLMVWGTANPLILNPTPEALAADIVTVAVPEFVRVIETDPLLPTSRFPKLTLAGFAESCPCVPVPLRAIVKVGLEALLVTVIVAEAFPVAVGTNRAVKLVL